MKNTFLQSYTINSFQVDPLGKARLTALANYLQETAYKHADSLHLGYRHLAENQSAWVLSRLRIRVLEYPDWDEALVVETWPRGIEKLFAMRDFRIRNSKEKVVAEATTAWLMVDAETHRPQRIPPDFIRIETRSDSVFEQSPGKIPVSADLRVCDTRTVKYADLDVVGHVNNVKYIEWCVDAVDPDLVMQRGISGFNINFISEARLGEQVEIRCSELQTKGSDREINRPGSEKDDHPEKKGGFDQQHAADKEAFSESGDKSPQASLPASQKMYISGHNLNTGHECFRAVLTFPPTSYPTS